MACPLLTPERRPLAALIALGGLGMLVTALLSVADGRAPTAGHSADLAKAGRFQAHLVSTR